jgi:hypothetical protein
MKVTKTQDLRQQNAFFSYGRSSCPLREILQACIPLALSRVSLGARQDAQRVVPYLLFEHLIRGVAMGPSHDRGVSPDFLAA